MMHEDVNKITLEGLQGEVTCCNWSKDGNPMGGWVLGEGIEIAWQDGVIADNGVNGALVEDVLMGVRSRLEYYQESKFMCQENEEALAHLELCLEALHRRRQARKMRGVYSSYEL